MGRDGIVGGLGGAKGSKEGMRELEVSARFEVEGFCHGLDKVYSFIFLCRRQSRVRGDW